jgi:tRNA dimethylallyltransferase
MQVRCELKTIILIAGPTGVGKTALSMTLADRLRTQVVNADSMQVYRYLDIGTAKPDPRERIRVRHHLLDVVDPDELFDAARYLEFAAPVIDKLHRQGMVPLIVGGTGLYMKVLTRGICQVAPVDPDVRELLLEEEKTLGVSALHRELNQVDPSLATRTTGNASFERLQSIGQPKRRCLAGKSSTASEIFSIER